jgi:hypothetical protein
VYHTLCVVFVLRVQHHIHGNRISTD